jgi:PAS domain S-box-containing protein
MAAAKILIADDEPLNLMLYSEMLKSDSYSCITAKDGLIAVDLAIIEIPDLIILDWNMPRLNGLDALKKIKNNPDTKEIPVIMITGIMTSPENLKSALEAGAIDFLRKPFDKIEFLARVRSMLLLSRSIKEVHEKYVVIERNNIFINSLMESIPHPMVYYSLDGKINGCNRRFEEFFNQERDSIKGTMIYQNMYNSGKISHQMYDQELINMLNEISYETKWLLTNRDLIFSKTVYFNSEGDPDGIMCIITDITDLKQIHNELLESKKRELTSSALRLIHISEMNNNLISELDEISEHADKKGKELIRNTISRFNVNSSENVWQEFETRFANVYESFYNKLNAQFPDLTPGEKKLCALLRLNLSSKDIAAITFQNSQSVDMSRYRLRKKMNLNPDENLIDYLMNIN